MGHVIVALSICAALLGPSSVAAAGEVLDVGRTGYQALPSLLWQQLDAAAETGDKVVVVFTADWCSPCKTLKEVLEQSPMVQRSVRDLRLLFIDVDEWRGPAHHLVPGAMPSKLPMLARLDERGELVQLAMGTQMGLLSAEATSGNFRRLAFGKAPERAAYMDDPKERTALAVAQSRRRKAQYAGVAPLEVEVQGVEPTADGGRRWSLKVTIRNLDSRRRWFVLPGRLGAEQPAKFQATGRETLRFTEHVRAHMTHFTGPHELYVLPLASGSDAVLSGWTVDGANGDRQFDVIALNRLRVAGEVVQFDKKVSYELRIANAGATRVASRTDTAVEVEFQSQQTFSASLADAVQTH